MKHFFIRNLAIVSFLAVAATGCKKDKEEVNEEELITTVKLNFTEAGTTSTTTFTFRDIDGDGGNPPGTFDNIVLSAGKTYNVTIELLDESKSPAENITEEVEEEATDHQFYFVPSGVNVTVNALNADANGLPLGTRCNWVTGAASAGTVKVVLKHKPDQKAAGDPVTKGETDIELDFSCRVN
jgi:hypothetical protein